MKFLAPGDSSLRALYVSCKGAAGKVAGRIAVAAFSPILTRLGAVLFVAAGLAGLSGVALQIAAELRAGPYTYMNSVMESRLWGLSSWLEGPLTLILVGLGIVGILPLIPFGKKFARILAASGVILMAVSALLPTGLMLYWEATNSQSTYGVPLDGIYALVIGLYGLAPVGLLLAAVAALWARGLGVLRFLPLALVVAVPLASALIIPYSYSGGTTLGPREPSLAGGLVAASPALISGLGCATLGCWMYGAVARDARRLEKQRRDKEERNLARTRRLYESIWRDGDPSVADEILAPGFRDLRQDGGPETFKRSAGDLLRSFPDLELEIQSQRARNDAVLTRCTFYGTDTGGVLWFPPTGERATFSATFHDRFSREGLVEHRGRFEREILLEQLGLPRTGGEQER